MNSEARLVQSAALMARTAPDVWVLFLEALAMRATEASDNMLASDLATLQINQGRAQAYRAIYKVCSEAVRTQDQIERGRK